MSSKSPYYYLSEFRTELMGIAILWISLYHSGITYDLVPDGPVRSLLLYVKALGLCGVDIFFLCSGMGVYRSLQKNSVSTFLKNRVKRIAPAWWTFMILFALTQTYVLGYWCTKKELFGFATFTGMWLEMDNQGNWYVYVSMLLYLISPAAFSVIRESRNKALTGARIVALAFVISLAAVGNRRLIYFSRFPIFFLGMTVAAALQDCTMNRKKWLACALGCAVGFGSTVLSIRYLGMSAVWKYGLHWYPNLLAIPTFCLLIGRCFEAFPRALKPLRLVLRGLGRSSLEIMLISGFFFVNLAELEIWNAFPKYVTDHMLFWCGIVFGCLFHLLLEYGKKFVDWSRGKIRMRLRTNV